MGTGLSLLTVRAAQERLLALARPLSSEMVPLAEAHGRHLAQDVAALRSQPASDLSAMDGYAIRFADLPGPWRLIGESAAGAPFGAPVGPFQAVRIFTGAVMPTGADTVLLQEDAEQADRMVRLTCEGPDFQGHHVRSAGSDFAVCDVLLKAGRRLGPTQLALAAMAGYGTLKVGRLPRVAIFATGDELVDPGEVPGPGQIPSSNNVMLTSLLSSISCRPVDQGIVPDRLDILVEAFEEVDADIIVTIGGVSVGDHDLVRPALEAAGGALDFWRVAMKPGKPLMAGRMRDMLVIGLPGNPGSALVTALLFLLPVVRHMAGGRDCLPVVERRRLVSPVGPGGSRAEYLRSVREGDAVRPLTRQDSGMVSTLSQADGLIVRPIDAQRLAPGEEVDFIPFP